MKVTIQHSIDLDDIPNKIREFLMKAVQKSDNIEAGLRYVVSLVDDNRSLQEQLERMDKVRRDLAEIDLILLDSSDILHGYQRALVQLREPQAPQTNTMEENHDDETGDEEIKEG